MSDSTNTPPETPKNNLSILDTFKIIYNIALISGIILSILYFMFVVEAFPNLKDFSQIANYLIAIFSSAMVYILILSLFMILPSIIFSSMPETINNTSHQVVFGFMIAPFLIHIFFSILYAFKLFIFKDPDFLLIANGLTGIAICISLWVFRGYKNAFPIFYGYLIYWLLSLFFTLYLLNSLDSKDIWYDIVFTLIIIIVLVGFNVYTYHKNLSLQTQKVNLKELVRYIIIITLFFTAVVTFFYLMRNATNPIVVKSFEILKMGHYVGKLQFKEEFNKNVNPFPLNETYKKDNVFAILSSIGDEYIIKERYPLEIVKIYNDHNITLTIDVTQINGNTYWYSDDKIWNKYENIGQDIYAEQNATKIKDFIAQHRPNYRVYRIKKDNVVNEIFGRDIDRQNTKWEIYSKD